MAQLLRLPGQAATGLLLVRRGRGRGGGSGTKREEADLADEPSSYQPCNLLLAYSDGRLTPGDQVQILRDLALPGPASGLFKINTLSGSKEPFDRKTEAAPDGK